jgi:hypothetical protein
MAPARLTRDGVGHRLLQQQANGVWIWVFGQNQPCAAISAGLAAANRSKMIDFSGF